MAGTHSALNEILIPRWNPSCLTIVSFVHFYPSYRKLKRKVLRAIAISDLIQNLNNSVLYTFYLHTRTHTIFSMHKNESISTFNDPWLHLKGLQPLYYIYHIDSVYYHKRMEWSHIFSIIPFMKMSFQSQLLIINPAVGFILQFKSQVSRAMKVLLCITI